MTQLLLYISAISFAEVSDAGNLCMVPGEGVIVPSFGVFSKLPLVRLAKLSFSSKVENKSRIFTAKLSASLASQFTEASRRLVFCASTVKGERYLIGAPGFPSPLVNVQTVFPERESDQSGYAMEVEYTDHHGLLRVLN